MADALQRHYIPKRLRRPDTVRKDQRSKFGETEEHHPSVIRKIVESPFHKHFFVSKQELVDLGASHAQFAATVDLTTLQIPNAQRQDEITFAQGINWNETAFGNMLSMGDGTDGFACWMQPGARVECWAQTGGYQAFATLDLPPSGANAFVLLSFTVNPLRVTLGLDWSHEPNHIDIGRSVPANGGDRWAPDDVVGHVGEADPLAPFGPGVDPQAGLDYGGTHIWFGQHVIED